MVVSQTGSWMQGVALSWLVYRLTRSELILGTTNFFAHLPTLFLSPLAGALADRWDRRRMVIIVQTLFLCHAGALAVLTFQGWVNVWWITVLALAQGLVDAFDRPARQTLLIQLTDRESLLSAISLNSVMFNLSRIVGPSLGGLVVAAFGEGVCFTVNAVSFLAVILALSSMRLTPETSTAPSRNPWRDLRDGFAYVAQVRPLVPLLAISTAVHFAVAPMFTLAPVLADGVFQRGSAGTGFLMGALGAGAVVGTLTLASRGTTHGLWRVSAQNTGLLAVALTALAAAPRYEIALAVMPLVGFSLMRQNASTNTQVQTMLEGSYRGRVMGIYTATVIGMFPLGSLAGGAVAALWGVRTTLVGCAVLLMAAAVWFWRVASAMNRQGEWETPPTPGETIAKGEVRA